MSAMSDQDQPGGPNQPDQAQFAVQQIYLKDLSFESPLAPAVFTSQAPQEVNLQLDSAVQPLSDERFEVVLTLIVTASRQDETVYLVEIKQAGLFLIRGVPEAHLAAVLNIHCPNILFPFARETVATLVAKGGFPQLLLQPIDFEGVYRHYLSQRQDRDEGRAPADG